MKLGSSARIAVSSKDVAASYEFFKKMGFAPVGDQSPHIATNMSFLRLTDGQVILTLLNEQFESPLIAYFAQELSGIGAHVRKYKPEAELTNDEAGKLREVAFMAPGGVIVDIHRDTKNFALKPAGTLNPRCGTFGEFTIGVDNCDEALSVWKHFGFDSVSSFTDPYPWSIIRDGNIVIGLHESTQLKGGSLTYFAPDAASKIAALKADGIVPVLELPDPDGTVANASFRSPDGVIVNLFMGQL